MPKLYAACALLLCLGLASAQDIRFPYCRCIDYDKVSSPYVVQLQSTSSGSGRYSATFTIVDAAVPANPTECYDRIKATGVPKIEFSTSTACLAAGNKPTVTINGVLSPSSGAVPPPNFEGKAAIKVGFKPNYKGGAITFTITGYGACANWNTLFNAGSYGVFQWAVFSDVVNGQVCCPAATIYAPPPQPIQPSLSPAPPTSVRRPPPVGPGPSGFPFCRCDRTTANTPYRFGGIAPSSSTYPSNVKWWTITLRTVACDKSKPSCTFTLDKIEMLVRPECKSSLYGTAYITAKGSKTEARTLQFQSYGPTKLVGKVTRIGWTPAQADGATISIGTLKGSACPSPAELFYSRPQIAFFSPANTYCPTFVA